ncbi:cutinase [Magnaporthiopsis poae ATCC 64411]|uniref:Cutinase n=1 Tax=Magnaporthiopsis poae (strain ATCC 64411 / 73-15) TaxID=644358 RepID=A0A0C4EEL9_MAGP6|nr:cutinase [Magnaporthiopsis poae ATCC 64411]
MINDESASHQTSHPSIISFCHYFLLSFPSVISYCHLLLSSPSVSISWHYFLASSLLSLYTFTRPKMRFSLAVTAAFVARALAAPLTLLETEYSFPRRLVARQTVGTEANEFKNGPCRDIVLLFARGSTQDGNMGQQPGPDLANAMKAKFGADRVAAQGMSYAAILAGNLAEGGATSMESSDFADLIKDVAVKCPDARIVVSGYSQGAALVHRAMRSCSVNVKTHVAAAVTFGDTQNKQDGGRIPGFDASKTLIICNDGDMVCDGTLMVMGPHMQYQSRVPEAVNFISTLVA